MITIYATDDTAWKIFSQRTAPSLIISEADTSPSSQILGLLRPANFTNNIPQHNVNILTPWSSELPCQWGQKKRTPEALGWGLGIRLKNLTSEDML